MVQAKRFVADERDRDPSCASLARAAAEVLEAKKFTIADFPSPGINYVDCYRTFDRNPDVRKAVLDCLRTRYEGCGIDAVAGIATGGLSLGSGLAMQLGVPFHPLRRPGKTVHDATSVSFDMKYATREITLANGIVASGSTIVLCDDAVNTGCTVMAAIGLLKKGGGVVVEVATLFEIVSGHPRGALAPIPLFAIAKCDD
jgi:adenine phosphoribosyltransferase